MTRAYDNIFPLELPLKKSYASLIIDCTVNPTVVKPGTIDDLIDHDAFPATDTRIGAIQWRPYAIQKKYNDKSFNVMRDARAKCHGLRKKYDKLRNTEKRMLEQERWDEYYKANAGQAEIAEEEYDIMAAARKICIDNDIKMNEELMYQNMVFEELIKLYFKLVSKQQSRKE